MGINRRAVVLGALASLATLVELACTRSAATPSSTAPAPSTGPMVNVAAAVDTMSPVRQRAVAALLQRIAGRENEPAEAVFRNVKILKTVPARQFLEIMDDGFGHGLGVGCGFCHVPGQFASDERPNKNVARDMLGMVNRINTELRGMPNLPDPQPRVGCITCHRMAQKPVLIGTGR